jgi:hypothetical protein
MNAPSRPQHYGHELGASQASLSRSRVESSIVCSPCPEGDARTWPNTGYLDRLSIAYTGKWRDLWYSMGSVSDLSLDQETS